jgi:hypothetical protein
VSLPTLRDVLKIDDSTDFYILGTSDSGWKHAKTELVNSRAHQPIHDSFYDIFVTHPSIVELGNINENNTRHRIGTMLDEVWSDSGIISSQQKPCND